MPIKYIGRVTHEEGKTLWQILCRLRNFGVGRMVYRNRFHQNYAEPSYYVISKVAPDMSDPEFARSSNAWGYKVWRGMALGEMPITVGFKPDWKLVPRSEEDSFRSVSHTPLEQHAIEDFQPLPPLIQHMMKMQKPNAEVPNLKLKINKLPHNRAVLKSQLENPAS